MKKLYILLDVLVASGLLRHYLYSNTTFSEELRIPWMCRIICFLGYPCTRTTMIWVAAEGWWKKRRSQETWV